MNLGKRVWAIVVMWALACLTAPAFGQSPAPDWESEARRYINAQDWTNALRIVDEQIAHHPQDMDIHAWRARILTWSGKLAEADAEYQHIVKVSANDPDVWLGISSLYMREGRTSDALTAINRAIELDPKRADLHEARARVLRALGETKEARSEFLAALDIDPGNNDARAGLITVPTQTKQQLRFGQETDLLSYTSAYNDQFATLTSQWTPRWATSVAGDFYERGGINAGKFIGGVTGSLPHWGALTIGGAVGDDNGVIPKGEAFFELDHAMTISETAFVRGLEFTYGQHWYWYQGAHILTLTGTGLVYLPREWTWSSSLIGARSGFTGTGTEWRPSGVSRLGFPLLHRGYQSLSGNVFFAVGNETFAEVDQIGSFASQTYGGGLRYQFSPRQDVTGWASFQQRTQNRADTNFGMSYGIRF